MTKPRLIDVFEIHGVGVGADGLREVVDIKAEVMSGTEYVLRFTMEDFSAVALALHKHLVSKGVSGS